MQTHVPIFACDGCIRGTYGILAYILNGMGLRMGDISPCFLAILSGGV